ncbi:hypothetical protein B0H13DRAFT_2422846 [Mycena leptocephala]|nr:hypothetical protein B0H13DRAFT_2422846 [Mycena leptocephala]
MDSNSHHVLWDSKTNTATRTEDFELHDLLISTPLLLVTPPDIPTHISGNVIDLGFCSPSLLIDHLPIRYTLDFDVMDLEKFLATLRHYLGMRPVPVITTQAELDEATSFLCEVLLAALEGSTPRHRPCSFAKRWWSPHLSHFLRLFGGLDEGFKITWFPRPVRSGWTLGELSAARAGGFIQSAQSLKEQRSSVFPTIRDPNSGDIALSHSDRGRILGRACLAPMLLKSYKNLLHTAPGCDPALRADQAGSGTRGKRGGARSFACLREHIQALNTPPENPIDLAASLPILEERTFFDVTDTEVDKVILSASPWKAPDRYGLQMGFIQRGWPVIAERVREIFRSSVRLESLGFIDPAQHGGRPGHSTQQVIDGYIHRVRSELDRGNTVSTLFYDLKGAFNRISHLVVSASLHP